MMARRGMLLAAAMAGLLLGPGADAQTRKPRLPPGLDPGGVTIALVGTGLDYTRSDIAPFLARDGEGDLIGWDFVTNDNRPYAPSPNDTLADWGGDGTAIARQIAATGRVRLIPIRIDPARPETLAQAFGFAARTPARILLLPIAGEPQRAWAELAEAAARWPQIMFIATASSDTARRYPAVLKPVNMLLVNSGPIAIADVASSSTPAEATVTPAKLIARLMQSLQACAASTRGSLEREKFARLIGLMGLTEGGASTTSSDGDAACGIAILRP